MARQPDSADGPAADPAGVSARTADETRSRQRPRAGPQRRAKQLDGYVGFASLPDQVYRRAVRKGFHFTLMVVGESDVQPVMYVRLRQADRLGRVAVRKGC